LDSPGPDSVQQQTGLNVAMDFREIRKIVYYLILLTKPLTHDVTVVNANISKAHVSLCGLVYAE
jgi:hypothetical protein